MNASRFKDARSFLYGEDRKIVIIHLLTDKERNNYMGEKVLDLSKTVYALCNEYPELPRILEEIGFTDITKPGMLTTVGRFMTIPKGAAAKKKDLEAIKKVLLEHGFKII